MTQDREAPTNLIGTQARHQTRCPADKTGYRRWSRQFRCSSHDYYRNLNQHAERTRDFAVNSKNRLPDYLPVLA